MTATDPVPNAVAGGGAAAAEDGLVVELGVVDGTRDCTTTSFTVVTRPDASVELDDLVAVDQALPDGEVLTHYGMVTALDRAIEGASWSSDTMRVADATMPGETVRRAQVQVLRPWPERWVAPEPAQPVRRATGTERDRALFMDQMERRLPVGLDARAQPVCVDFDFLNGRKGGHVNVSGISGVATKTTALLSMLYLLFETDGGRQLLGRAVDQTRALVLSVKNEDLLHLDRPNLRLSPEDRERWNALGAPRAGAFTDVDFLVPARQGSPNVAPQTDTRPASDVTVFGWTPYDFIVDGLLAYVLADADDSQNQLSFVEQRVRAALARWAHPAAGTPGAVVLKPPTDNPPRSFERAVDHVRGRQPVQPGADGVLVRDFSELFDFIEAKLDDGEPDFVGNNAAQQTLSAFARRLAAMVPRIGHLVRLGVTAPTLDRQITVVDIHALHDSAQRFVVGAVVDRIFNEKQASGREPLRFIMLDELNKFCPDHGRSPLRDLLVDVAERGRSMGVLLFGAQQHAGSVHPTVVRNAAVKLVGRLDAGDLDSYKFLPAEMRTRATLFVPGSMVLHQPVIPAPIPIRIPFPPFATSHEEAQPPPPDPGAIDPFALPGAGG